MRDLIRLPAMQLTHIDEEAHVPCGSCKLCCQRFTAVAILPQHGDDPEAFETRRDGGILMLKHKDNGDCVYLNEKGCSIHGRAPYMCRTYDCREQHKMYSKQQRRTFIAAGMLDPQVLRRGAALIQQAKSIPAPDITKALKTHSQKD